MIYESARQPLHIRNAPPTHPATRIRPGHRDCQNVDVIGITIANGNSLGLIRNPHAGQEIRRHRFPALGAQTLTEWQ